MTSDSFPYFMDLPTELRLEIWGLALRPTHAAAAHRFSIYDDREDAPCDPLRRLCIAILGGQVDADRFSEAATTRVVRAPSDSGESEHSHRSQQYSDSQCSSHFERPQMDGNASAYLYDAGLWTACKESREVITKHMRKRRKNASYRDHPKRTTVRIKTRGKWFLTVQPKRDLFCLQLHEGLVGRRGMELLQQNRDLMFDIPRSIASSSRRLGFDDIRNIAVEFDASWLEDLWSTLIETDNNARGVVARLLLDIRFGVLASDTHIWLIDRSLRDVRRDVIETGPAFPRKRFYDCEHEYMETWYSDVDREKVDWEKVDRQEGLFSVFDFVERMQDIGWYDDIIDTGRDEFSEQEYGYFDVGAVLGVLAYA